jgi:hypothetical protein
MPNPEWSISDGGKTMPADPAVFQGSLVNLKNSPTHKSVILQVEIPEEYGEAIVRAFGWPTRVKPLSVAIAKLANQGEPGPSEPPRSEVKLKPKWEDMPAWKQAAILCKEPSFKKYLGHEYSDTMHLSKDDVAMAVRFICGVGSRREIDGNKEAYRTWKQLMGDFCAWHDAKGFSACGKPQQAPENDDTFPF